MLIWILITIGLLAFDQFTKAFLLAKLPSINQTWPIIQDFFHFTHVENDGAIFGFGGENPGALYFFIGAAVVALVAFGSLFFRINFQDPKIKWYSLSLSMLTAGTIGNMIDRIFRGGLVIDFIDFRGIWPYVFNIADMCLTVGIALFLFDQLILEPKRVKKNETK